MTTKAAALFRAVEKIFGGFCKPATITLKMMNNDLELLRDYVQNRAENSFAALVNRHLNLVYSAALRQLGSPQHAEEVAQAVFMDLSQHASRLRPDTILPAWLYQVARRTAVDLIRRESRRQLREKVASEINAMNATDEDWTRIAPLLDEAMSVLDDTDRAAVLLRYFENKTLREVGLALGASEDAAQKRVSRAVESLREFFAKRGVSVGAGGLVVILSAQAVQAAPVGLAVVISTAVVSGTLATATLATQTTMNWINFKSIAAILTAALAAGTTVHLVRQTEANRLRNENHELTTHIENLTSERDAALASAGQLREQFAEVEQNKSELLRLRGEVGLLRRQAGDLSRLEAENRSLRALTAASDPATAAKALLSPEAALNACLNNLRQIDAAMQQCALENRLVATNVVTEEQLLPYFLDRKMPVCPAGGHYQFGSLTQTPTCSIPGHEFPASIESPAVELQAGPILQAIFEDYRSQLTTEDLAAARKAYGAELTEAHKAYARDHNGQTPKGINQIVLYLKQPGPRLRDALDSFRRDHGGQAATNVLELSPYF